MAKRLGEQLVAEKLLSSQQLEEAVEAQCLYGGRLGTNILELGYLSDERLAESLSQNLELPSIRLSHLLRVPEEVIELVDPNLARLHLVVPCNLVNNKLYLVMADPTDTTLKGMLEYQLNFEVVPVIVPEIYLRIALNKYYGIEMSTRFYRTSKQLISEYREHYFTLLKKKRRKVKDPELIAANDLYIPDDYWPMLKNETDKPFDGVTLIRNSANATQADINAEEKNTTTELSEAQIFEKFCKSLVNTNTRHELGEKIIKFLEPQFTGVSLLTVKDREATGWIGSSFGQRIKKYEDLHISLEDHSILKTISESKTHFLGAMPKDSGANIKFVSHFGGHFPKHLCLIPLVLKDRVVGIFHIQDTRDGFEEKLQDFEEIGHKLVMAFEMLILKNKIMMRSRKRVD